MEKDFVYYTLLFDIYGNLLTKKQQDYFKEYYFNNLTCNYRYIYNYKYP